MPEHDGGFWSVPGRDGLWGASGRSLPAQAALHLHLNHIAAQLTAATLGGIDD